MKKVIIKKGNYSTDGGEGLDLITLILNVLNENGISVNSCCGGKSLDTLNFVDNAAAILGGLKKGSLYHTSGIVKVVI